MTTAPHAGKPGTRNARSRITQEMRLEAAVILHVLSKGGMAEIEDNYLRIRPIVYRAMGLLEDWKFLPARISNAKVPVDIIALRNDMTLLVQVISSKKPVPDAKALIRNYAKKIDSLRQMGSPNRFTKIFMAYSKICGWKFYEVLPGGLLPAWHLPDVPAP